MPNTEITQYDNMIYDKLHEAELQAASTSERLTHDEVLDKARKVISSAEERKE